MTAGGGKSPACYGDDMSIAPDEPGGVVAEAAEIRAAVARAIDAARSSPDHVQAFLDVTALGELMKQAESDAAGMRADNAARLADEGDLSVTEVARRLGVSRSRAHQLVTAGRRRRARS